MARKKQKSSRTGRIRTGGDPPLAETRQRHRSSRKRKPPVKKGLQLYPLVTALLVGYFVIIFAAIIWVHGEGSADTLGMMLARPIIASSIFIGLPTLLVWLFSRSQKASNLTCAGTVCFLLIALASGVFFPPKPAPTPDGKPAADIAPQATAAADDIEEPIETEDRVFSGPGSEVAATTLQAMQAELAVEIGKYDQLTQSFINSGGIDPRSLSSEAVIDQRIAMTDQAIEIATQIETFYKSHEERFTSQLQDAGLAEEQINLLVDQYKATRPTQYVLPIKYHEIAELKYQHEMLIHLKNYFGKWWMEPNNAVVFSGGEGEVRFYQLLRSAKNHAAEAASLRENYRRSGRHAN